MINPGTFLSELRNRKPLVHHIMNGVTMNFVANGLLAAGGKPMMARHSVEVVEAVQKADALVLNIGTPDPQSIEAMVLAGKEANSRNIPVVLDPVGIGMSQFRINAVERIQKEVSLSAIRGNAAEIAYLIGLEWQGRGVDGDSTSWIPSDLAFKAANELRTLIIVSGQKDYISDGNQVVSVANGDEWLTLVTGTGCLATSLVASFLSTDPIEMDTDHKSMSNLSLSQASTAMIMLGVAAEEARIHSSGPGSFNNALMDALYQLSPEEITKKANFTFIR
ncbi:MAG: hydroxyethylthiazole kinase [Bacilli bacterium]